MGRPKKPETIIREEIRKQNMEMAAIAAVKMENGEYHYPEGTRHSFDAEGKPNWNASELCRVAGVPGYAGNHPDKLLEHPYFVQMVELHRLRRRDPNFRRDLENPGQLWADVGNESLKNIYEAVFYHPHSVTLDQHMKIVKLMVDAGIAVKTLEQKTRTDALLETLTPEQRKIVLESRIQAAEAAAKDLRALQLAHMGADAKESE